MFWLRVIINVFAVLFQSGMYGTVGDGTEKEQIKDKSRKKKSGQLSPRTHGKHFYNNSQNCEERLITA